MKKIAIIFILVCLVSACGRTPTRQMDFAKDVQALNCEQLESEMVYQATILANLKRQHDKEMDMNGAAAAALTLGFSAINNVADDDARRTRVNELRRNLALIETEQHEKGCTK